MGTRKNRLGEAVLTRTQNLCLKAKVPQFHYLKVGYKGYVLHGHVFLMMILTAVPNGMN